MGKIQAAKAGPDGGHGHGRHTVVMEGSAGDRNP